jgi:hypothetical protein
LPPRTDEVFNNLNDCQSILRGFALAEGFNIIKHDGDIKKAFSSKYKCIFHSRDTQNYYKLENYIERDSKSRITSKRQKDVTSVR